MSCDENDWSKYTQYYWQRDILKQELKERNILGRFSIINLTLNRNRFEKNILIIYEINFNVLVYVAFPMFWWPLTVLIGTLNESNVIRML